jgi:protein TonB
MRSIIMLALQRTKKERITAALGSAAITALLGYALLTGFGVHPTAVVSRELDIFNIMPDTPVPPPVKKPPPPKHAHKNGASGPPALRAKATEIVAPPPVLPVVPPPIAVTKTPGIGAASSQGASSLPGSGNGGGGSGDGDGDGDGGGTAPEYRSGRIKDSDYPRTAFDANASGTVSVRYTVTTKGRATDCRVTRSSGNMDLDSTTCRLIEERFRYAPSRDASGNPVESEIVENHSWTVHREQPSDSH